DRRAHGDRAAPVPHAAAGPLGACARRRTARRRAPRVRRRERTGHANRDVPAAGVRALAAELPRTARPGQLALLLRTRARRDQSGLMRVLRAAVSRGDARAVQSLWID